MKLLAFRARHVAKPMVDSAWHASNSKDVRYDSLLDLCVFWVGA